MSSWDGLTARTMMLGAADRVKDAVPAQVGGLPAVQAKRRAVDAAVRGGDYPAFLAALAAWETTVMQYAEPKPC